MRPEEEPATPLLSRLLTLPQYVIPQHLLTRGVHALTHSTWGPWKNFLIRRFIAWYRVDMSTALEPAPEAYPSFNAFFTRALRPDARPVADEPRAIACPIDGALSQAGRIEGTSLIQAKGRRYTLHQLLAGDDARTRLFENGHYATLYLSPRDYHRIHMPVDGRLREITYVPGRLFAVNARTARVVEGVFARNERAICLFDTEAGPMAVILVAALFVSGMETVWTGPLSPAADGLPYTRAFDAQDPDTAVPRGAELGRFNMGSTVILLFARDRIAWSDGLLPGTPLCMGQPIGRVASPASS